MGKAVPTLCAVVTLAVSAGQAGAQSRQFQCGDGSTLTLKVLNATTIAVGPIGGKTVALRKVPDQALTFAYDELRLDIARDQKSVTLSPPGGGSLDCTYPGASGSAAGTQAANPPASEPRTSRDVATAAPRQPAAPADQSASPARGFPAKSWGGVVRAGPGMDHRKLASLQEGDPIAILENAGAEMNGYPWFKIRYGRDKTGYQWGGIICPVGRPVAGTFEQCD
jgi:hypothetical protein